MNSNSKSPVSGDLISNKPNGKDGVSSAEPIKAMNSNSKSHVSSDLISKIQNGKDAVSSAEPIKRTGQTGVSYAKAVSGDPMSKKPNGKAVVCSEVPIKHSGGNGVPPAKTDEVLFFRDVKFGPQEGELRFRLIHFWEAWNALTKILIGLEILLIDEQVYSDIFCFSFFHFACSIKLLTVVAFSLSTGYYDPKIHPPRKN